METRKGGGPTSPAKSSKESESRLGRPTIDKIDLKAGIKAVISLCSSEEWEKTVSRSKLTHFMNYIDILKQGIRALHYAGPLTEQYQELIIKLETHVAIKLLNKYHDTHHLLTAREWEFLAIYILNYGDKYININNNYLKTFFELEEDYRLSNKASLAELDAIFQSKKELLFEKAGQTIQKFIKLGKKSPQLIPEQPYNPKKTAGFITLSVDGGAQEIRQVGTGDILEDKDEEFGTKGNRYKQYSAHKDLYATLETKEYSEQTMFKIKGRIQIEYEGKKIGFSCSGRTELQDQAIVTIAAYDAGMISDTEFVRRKEKLNNPYLEEGFLTQLRGIE